MNRKVAETLREMTQPGDHVICAVSGGKDSMALLHCVWNLREVLEISVSAAHFNHQLRGSESQRDAGFVKSYCKENGIPFDLGQGDVAGYAQHRGLGIEEAARILRYRFLESVDSSAKIAMAHTAEDNLETILMHLIRGTTLHGLSGIPPVRGRLIRPLLTVNRRELADYLNANNIPHVEDSTNALDDGLRNRLRHHVLPLLEAENPNLAASITLLAQSLRREDDYLTEQAQAFLQDNTVDIPRLLSAHEAIQYRALRLLLDPVPGLGQKHLEAALKLCSSHSPSAQLTLPGCFRLQRVYGTLELKKQTLRFQPEEQNLRTATSAYDFGPWHIICRVGLVPEVLEENTLALTLQEGLSIRVRRPGDRIALKTGTKKVGRYLMDQKIPARLRDFQPLVCRGNEVLAVLPLRVAQGQQAAPGSTGLLLTAYRTEDV